MIRFFALALLGLFLTSPAHAQTAGAAGSITPGASLCAYNTTAPSIAAPPGVAAGPSPSGYFIYSQCAGNALVLTGLNATPQTIKTTAGIIFGISCNVTTVLEIFPTSTPTLGTTPPSWFFSTTSSNLTQSLPVVIPTGMYAVSVSAVNGSTPVTAACAFSYE